MLPPDSRATPGSSTKRSACAASRSFRAICLLALRAHVRDRAGFGEVHADDEAAAFRPDAIVALRRRAIGERCLGLVQVIAAYERERRAWWHATEACFDHGIRK